MIWSALCFGLVLKSELRDKNSEIMGVKTDPEKKKYKDRKRIITEANIPNIPAKHSYYKTILSFMISIAKTPKHLWTLGELMAKQYEQHKQTSKN